MLIVIEIQKEIIRNATALFQLIDKNALLNGLGNFTSSSLFLF